MTYPQANHLQSKKFNFLLKFCVKMLFYRLYFSPLNTFMRKGKNPVPDLDPYLWLMDPNPGGSKTCRSGSGSPTLLSGGTYIRYNSSSLVWEARRAGWPVVATSAASQKSFLVGTRQWTVQSDADCTNNSSQRLSLVTCGENQFNCDDGSCIDLQYRLINAVF